MMNRMATPVSRCISFSRFQVLRLYRHVQRRRRLVRDEQPRLALDGDAADHALLHAAAHLVREVGEPPLRRRDAHHPQHLHRPLPHRLPPSARRSCGGRNLAPAAIRRDRLRQLVADGEHRVQRRLRVLQDHRYLASPHLPHVRHPHPHDVVPVEQDAPPDDARGLRQQAQQRQRRHALAGPGLPHEPERLAFAYLEAHPIDRARHPPLGEEVRLQLLHVQNDMAHLTPPPPRTALPADARPSTERPPAARMRRSGSARSRPAPTPPAARPLPPRARWRP